MVEEYAVYSKHAIAFAVVLCNPKAILFGYAIGAAGIERGRFALRHFLHFSEELGSGGLVDACLLFHTENAYGFEHAQGAYGIGFGGIFGHVEGYFDMALGGKVIYFVRLHTLDDTDERAGVCHVSIVQINGTFLFHVAYPLIEVEVFDAAGVERGRATQDTVHFISFLQEEFGKERAVLPGNAGDKGFLHNVCFLLLCLFGLQYSLFSTRWQNINYFFPITLSIISAIAPSPVTLQAVPKLSIAM